MSDLEAVLATIPNMSAFDLVDRWQALGRGTAPRVPLRLLQRLYSENLRGKHQAPARGQRLVSGGICL